MDKVNEIGEPVLDFKIDFSYELKKEKALSHVKGSISKGRCVVLCGGSGSGKSTLLRCLNHLIPEFYEGLFNGYILVNDKNISHKNMGEVGELISSVFQDPRSQFFTMESDTEVSFGLENKGLSFEKIRERTKEAFSKFNLEYLENREVFKLSSGERQLIAIMAAWAMDTDIILFDEPTANLDYLAIEKLKEILLLLKKEGKTLLISEHRLYYLQGLADEFWLMKNGSIYEKYEQNQLLAFSPSELNDLGLRVTDLKQIQIQSGQSDIGSDKLEVRNLFFSYQKQKILKDISLTTSLGEITCLIGKNGCGKTTLGKCISGLLRSPSGSIFLNGEEMSSKKLVQESLFIMQEAEFQFFTNSVLLELKYGLNPSRYVEIEPLLKKFDMWEYRNRHPFSLSGGQMQKLTLMMAYLSDKRMIVLDEPTSGLDKKSLDTIIELIKEMKKQKIVVVISHDLELIAAVSNKCLEIHDGVIQRICEISSHESIKNMIEIFETNDFENRSSPKKRKKWLDPRTNLLFLLFCMIAVGIDHKQLIFEYNLLALLFSIVNRRYKSFIVTASIISTIYGFERMFPCEMTWFMANLLPRFILLFSLFPILLGGRGATYMLAGLRKIGVPERILLILSVSFRFFPVLQNDFNLSRQVLKMRGSGTCKNIIQKKLAYLEALVISLVFRVIRIGETLSASAETRGIGLKHKKGSYISLRFNLFDYLLMIGMTFILIINIFEK